MKILAAVGTIALVALSTTLTYLASDALGSYVEVDDHRIRVRQAGDEGPSVVFDMGWAPLEFWAPLQNRVAIFARTLSYDHAGYWGSESCPSPRDSVRIADELRELLGNSDLEPPYTLVGASFGGIHVRVFAHRYPELTAGLVLCDPTDEDFMRWLKRKYPHVNRIDALDRERRNEQGSIPESFEQARKAWPLPNVPVVVLTGLSAKGDSRRRELLGPWREHHARFVDRIPGARHLLLDHVGHGIPFEEPGIVADEIRRMLEGTP